MKLLIASDIHGSALCCRKLLQAYALENASRLVLLGDLLYHGPRNDLPEQYAPKEVAAMLNSMADSILCVRGNCDAEVDQMMLDFPIMAEYAALMEGEHMIYLTHGHVWNSGNMPKLHSGDILIHGHTHIPLWEEKEGIHVLNPGSISIPKGGSQQGYMTWEKGVFLWKTLEGQLLKQLYI